MITTVDKFITTIGKFRGKEVIKNDSWKWCDNCKDCKYRIIKNKKGIITQYCTATDVFEEKIRDERIRRKLQLINPYDEDKLYGEMDCHWAEVGKPEIITEISIEELEEMLNEKDVD